MNIKIITPHKTILFLVAFIVLLLVILISNTDGYPKKYSSESVFGYVIDSESKAGVSNVLVVAVWILEGGAEGFVDEGILLILEKTTDKDGYFYFENWGPIPIPENISGNARLKGKSPILLFFKDGYQLKSVKNYYNPGSSVPSFRKSDWSGSKIEITKNDNKDKLELKFQLLKIFGNYGDVEQRAPKLREWIKNNY